MWTGRKVCQPGNRLFATDSDQVAGAGDAAEMDEGSAHSPRDGTGQRWHSSLGLPPGCCGAALYPRKILFWLAQALSAASDLSGNDRRGLDAVGISARGSSPAP